MSTPTSPRSRPGGLDLPAARTLLNKVPEVTAWFWVIKVLATTVGETFADFLATNLGLGLGGTSAVMTLVLVIALAAQLRADRYRAPVYWLTVVLISVVGTLLTDDLTDAVGVPLPVSTIVFAVALAATFAVWYSRERTLSIHEVTTTPRELFYWLAVLLTFALGTAAGDLLAEQVGLGYWPTALLIGVVIAAVAATRRGLRANAVACFWAAYVLTRPLGASLGDGFSQARADGGLGLGTTWTSVVFLAVILVCVTYLTVTRRDQLETSGEASGEASAAVGAGPRRREV